MLLLPLTLLFAYLSPIQAQQTYSYIVIGSGPGSGPLAANLARAGHPTLLLEAGDDQGNNPNVSMTYNANTATNDPSTRWDFWVAHSDDAERENKYLYTTWRKTDGGFYVGLNPPAGAKRLGVWYPRAGTLGGCAMHNAAVNALPANADWDFVAQETGDASWAAKNMRKYFVKLERCNYVANGSTTAHGFKGWLETSQADAGWANQGSEGRTLAGYVADATGGKAADLAQLLKRDMNADDPNRDTSVGIFGGLTHDKGGRRSSPNDYVKATLADARKFPLTVQLNALATKVLFSNSTGKPTAIGVEFLEGKSLYSADPRYDPNRKGTLRQALASKEVIVSGGVFNSPQILKLSGIGPAAELQKFNIPVVKDLPGVGANMQDNYESGVLGTFQRAVQGGFYHVIWKSSLSKVRDFYFWCGAFAFEGFWPGYPTAYPNNYECAFSHMNPKNIAGRVTLRSGNPQETPDINLGFFSKGSDEDLSALAEGANLMRGVFKKLSGNTFTEKHPCTKSPCTDADQKEYLRTQIYSHHATSSCAIGGDNNPMAVLDSKFRVRGVDRLRVVDGSAFPRVPGAFPVIPTFMTSEKAAEDILAAAK